MVAAPIGRAEIWRALENRLAARRSCLILIAGPPGSGRSHLLRRFGQAASEAGYTVAGCADPLPIESTTTLQDIARALAALVQRADRRPAGPDTPSAPWEKVVNAIVSRIRHEREVFATLDQTAPLCVGVDGYAPSPSLNLWITARLLRHVKASPVPILMIVADTAECLDALRSLADEVHNLGSLDEDEVGGTLPSLQTVLSRHCLSPRSMLMWLPQRETRQYLPHSQPF